MTTLGITIIGMTCNHCVRHVDQALRAVPGVSNVEIDLATGRATITPDAPVAIEQLIAAIEAAGYEASATAIH